MKKITHILLLTVSFMVAACQALPQTPSPTFLPATDTLPIDPQAELDELAFFGTGLTAEQQSNLEELRGATVYHLDYKIGADLAELEARAQILYTNQEGVPLEEVQLRLFPNILGGSLTIESLLRDGLEVQPIYGLADSLLRVGFEALLQPEESTQIEIQYRVDIPQQLESNYGVLASTEGVLTLAHAYPIIPVYDDEGWNAEIPSQQGDLTYADASFYLVKVQAPKDLTLAASGVAISREYRGEDQIVVFAAGPARDFFLSASRNYEVVSNVVDGVTINSYAPASMKDGSQLALETALKAVHIFSKRYGGYPYTELDIVATPTYALGVEYPGITAISLDLYDIQNGKYGSNTSIYLESTVAHEVGHQWFYNMVGNDQSDEPWLDESLTQYITWQYFQERYGPSGAAGFEQSLRGRWARVENKPIPVGLPVSAYHGQEYAAIVYGRGAFFFKALAEQMGQEAFDNFLMKYTEKHLWGTASTESLKSLAEDGCGCDLTALFNEWVYAQP